MRLEFQNGPKQHPFKVSPPMKLGFTIDKTRDPDVETLRSVLAAQFVHERMRATRSWFIHLLAVAGVIIWLETIWPDLVPADIRVFTLAVFGGILFLSIRAAIEEVVSRRRLKRYVADKKGVTLKDTAE
jgi:hypothetical protein